MPNPRLFAFLLCLLWLAPRSVAQESRKVLFIGNSLTYTNDLPAMLAQLAKAGGKPTLEYDSETPGGCSLEKHWKDGRALAKIQAKDWDYVVLHDVSNQALIHPESMATYGKLLAEAASKHKCKPAFYMTWAWKDQYETQPIITEAYTSLAKETQAVLIPAGLAWAAYRKAYPHQSLVTDNRHPDLGGTYLTACVFYAVLYETSPVGLPGDVAKLDAAQAKVFRETAWAAVCSAKAPKSTK